MKQAVLYLRSSKDRKDVSIETQRRELLELAASRKLAVVREFADVVLSGKDENRPAFQRMLAELAARDRPWGAILALDTSRIARNQATAHVLRRDCKNRGVELIFAKTPEMDGLAGIYLPAVLYATDEGHSYMSREKGLAGMAENVRRGFRAGGRAPMGYDLERIDTGVRRDGEAVLKSRLKPNDQAPAIASYLKGRAAGRSARDLVVTLGLDLPRSTLVGLEWNALTYAGHTVWNVHQERTASGYKGGSKRRPRSDWVIQRETHPALISEHEAEAILRRLEGKRGRYATRATYLLGGLLESPDGTAWHGNRDKSGLYYRAGRSNVKAERVEAAVLEQLAGDLVDDDFAARLCAKMRDECDDGRIASKVRAAQAQMRDLERRIERLTNLLQETSAPRPLLVQIEALEGQRTKALEDAAELRQRAELGQQAQRVRESDVAAFLRVLASRLATMDRDTLKAFLRTQVELVELDPASLQGRIRYGIRLQTGDFVASPRGFEPRLSP